MKITKEEIIPIAEAVREEVEAIYGKLSKRNVPFMIAYSIGTNSGEPHSGAYCSYVAPGGYDELTMLHHELIIAMSKSMSPNQE